MAQPEQIGRRTPSLLVFFLAQKSLGSLRSRMFAWQARERLRDNQMNFCVAPKQNKNKKNQARENVPPNNLFKVNPAPRKKNHGKDGHAISLKPEWFSVCQILFLRGFRFLSCLHSATRENSFSRSSAARSFGLWPTRKIPAARKKKALVRRGKTSAWTREEKTKLEID